MTAPLARSGDGPLEERPPEPARALPRVDPHPLDLGTPAALVGERGYEGELEDAHHLRVAKGHHQLLVGIAIDGGKGLEIRRRDRPLVALARTAERVVGEQMDE